MRDSQQQPVAFLDREDFAFPEVANGFRHHGARALARPPVGRCQAGFWCKWLLFNAVVNGILVALAPHRVEATRLVLASMMQWVATVPLLVRSYQKHNSLPFFESVSVVYFFYYGLGIFSDSVYVKRYPFESPAVTRAVGLALMGLIVLQFAYYGSGCLLRVHGEKRLPRISLPIDVSRLGTVCIFLAAGFLSISTWAIYFKLPTSIATIVGLASVLPLLLLSASWLLWLRGRATRVQKVLTVLVFAAYCLLRLGRGTLAPVLIAFAVPLFIYVRVRRSFPWKAMGVFSVAMLPLMLSKVEFRERTWSREELSVVQRVGVFAEVTAETIAEPSFAYRALKRSSRRTSYLGVLAYVVQQTPSRVPYWNGESYRTMLYTFVPRIVAPDKPKKEFGQRFGHRYRLIRANDYKTVVNFAQLVEMYANYGSWGIAFGMFIVGALYRLIAMLLDHDEGGDGPVLIAAVTYGLLMNIESDASLVLGGTFAAVTVFYVSLMLVKAFFERAPRIDGVPRRQRDVRSEPTALSLNSAAE